MPVRMSQIPAVKSLQAHLITLTSAPPKAQVVDSHAIAEIVTRLLRRNLTVATVRELLTAQEDVRGGVWEHGEASGRLSQARVAKRSVAAEEWYVRQPPVPGDHYDAGLRRIWRTLDRAVARCQTLLSRLSTPRHVRARRP